MVRGGHGLKIRLYNFTWLNFLLLLLASAQPVVHWQWWGVWFRRERRYYHHSLSDQLLSRYKLSWYQTGINWLRRLRYFYQRLLMQSCRLLGVKVGVHTVFCSAQSKYNSCMLKYSKIDFTCDCVANITEWTGGLHASVDCKDHCRIFTLCSFCKWLGWAWASPTLAWLHCTHTYVCMYVCMFAWIDHLPKILNKRV